MVDIVTNTLVRNKSTVVHIYLARNPEIKLLKCAKNACVMLIGSRLDCNIINSLHTVVNRILFSYMLYYICLLAKMRERPKDRRMIRGKKIREENTQGTKMVGKLIGLSVHLFRFIEDKLT